MVTWGANTVHTFGGQQGAPGGLAQPAAQQPAGGFSFGSQPPPAPTAGFGSQPPAQTTTTTTPLFGSTPAPSGGGGGLFGNLNAPATAPAPAPLFGAPAPAGGGGGGLFGSSTTTPAPGGLFGSSTAPAPAGGGGFFGSAAPAAPLGGGGFFGSSPGGLFGSQQQQQQVQPQQMNMNMIPAQAALQAHLDASARQEEARVTTQLEHVYKSYSGQEVASPSETKSADFTLLHYAAATQEILQQQWLLQGYLGGAISSHGQSPSLPGMMGGTALSTGATTLPTSIAPPRPLQVCERDWNRAVASNPDPTKYMPAAIVGAQALQARLTYQQNESTKYSQQLSTVSDTVTFLSQRLNSLQKALRELQISHTKQQKRLLKVMTKVELARCWNLTLVNDEVHCYEIINQMHHKLKQMENAIEKISQDCHTTIGQIQRRTTASAASTAIVPVVSTDVAGDDDHHATKKFEEEEEKRKLEDELLPILKDHRNGIANLVDVLKKDIRDIHLLQQHVVSNKPGSTTIVGLPRLQR